MKRWLEICFAAAAVLAIIVAAFFTGDEPPPPCTQAPGYALTLCLGNDGHWRP